MESEQPGSMAATAHPGTNARSVSTDTEAGPCPCNGSHDHHGVVEAEMEARLKAEAAFITTRLYSFATGWSRRIVNYRKSKQKKVGENGIREI